MSISHLDHREKLILSSNAAIIFIITEDCPFECLHCLRGDKRADAISEAVIDAVLSQIKINGTIYLTGGEPLLYIDKVIYLINKVYSLDNKKAGISIITNGSVTPARFERLIVALNANKAMMTIKVSNDYYHRLERMRLYGYDSELVEALELEKRVAEYQQIIADYSHSTGHDRIFLYLEEYVSYTDGLKLLPLGRMENAFPGKSLEERELGLFDRVSLINGKRIRGTFQVLPNGKLTSSSDMSWRETDLYCSGASVLDEPIAKILTRPKSRYNH